MWTLRDLSERIRARRRSLARAQQGFTLIEVMVAVLLIMIVLVPMSYVMTSALATGGCAQQRNAANSLVNQVLEQVRALAYTTVAAGDTTNDSTLSGDAHITVASGVYTYTGTGENMPTNSGAGSSVPAPINPHQTTVTENSTNYTVSTYVTYFGSVSNAYRVTAVASWSNGSCQGIATKVSAQTVVDQPNAITTPCASDSTHPFPAPCQPFFESESSNGQGLVDIQPADPDNYDALTAIPLTNAELDMPTLDCTLQLEQISTGTCKGVSSAATLAVSGSSTQSTGGQSTVCTFTSDPSGSSTCSASPSQSSTSAQSTGSGTTLGLSVSSGDSGTLAGTTSAGGTPACKDLTGTALTNSEPCDSGTMSQSGGALSATATLSTLGSVNLASIGTTATPVTVFNTEAVTSGDGGYCSTTSGDGCVHAGATRSLGAMGIAGLPAQVVSDLAALGKTWGCNGYLFQISNFSDTVSAESGVGAASPSAAQNGSTGQLSYWNGTSCATQAITNAAWGSQPPTPPISIPAVNLTDGSTTVTMTATITEQGTGTTSNTANCATTCTATATSGSPLTSDVIYEVTVLGTPVLDVDIHSDLGTLAAATAYTKKPGAS